jgi:hypothetical protein
VIIFGDLAYYAITGHNLNARELSRLTFLYSSLADQIHTSQLLGLIVQTKVALISL